MAVWDDAVVLWNPGINGGRSSNLVNAADSDAGLAEGAWTNDEGFAGRTYTGATGSRFTVSQTAPADTTIMFLWKANNGSDQWSGLAASGASNRYHTLSLRSAALWAENRNGSASGWPTATDATGADTDLHVVINRYDAAPTATAQLWVDGVLETSDTGNVGDAAVTLDRFTVGRLDRSGPINSSNLSVYAAAFWSRQLTDQEIADVTANPREYLLPAAPANPSATADSQTQITVDWDDVTGETGYRVERSANGTTGWTDVSGNLAADTITYADTGLTCNTQYFYRVFAFNGAGDSPASTVVNATTAACAGGGGNRMGGTGAIRKPPRTRR